MHSTQDMSPAKSELPPGVAPEGQSRRSASVRTCVGCRKTDAPSEMLRVSLVEGQVLVDLVGKGAGRGAWLHPSPECLRGAVKSGFSRSFMAKVSVDADAVGAQIRVLAERRVQGLLAAARGARKLAIGADEAEKAVTEGQAPLLLVACDAGAIANKFWVVRAVAEGRAVAWGTKEHVGQMLGRGAAAVVAVRDQGLSLALSWAIKCAQFPMPKPGA